MIGGMLIKSFNIVLFRSSYRSAIESILARDPNAGFLVTQPEVLNLYINPAIRVLPAPRDLPTLMSLYARGYHYLIIDPQIYVSWTADGKRFTPQLIDYMNFIRIHVPARAEFTHMNHLMLERFVLDHNENLINSLRFLNARHQEYGKIYVYDILDCLMLLNRADKNNNL